MNHTEVNREHVWRLLQGGELIAPVPPLPPRETPDAQPETPALHTTQPGEKTEAAPPTPIKKTRTRKKAEVASDEAAEPGSVVQADRGVASPVTPPKRYRVGEPEAEQNV